MKKYRLNEDFGGMNAGDIIETDGELGDVFPSGSLDLIEEAELEVATPEGNDEDGESDDDENDAHIDNQHGGIIPSHYNPVVTQVQVEQLKPKRGRPSSK